MFTTKRDIIEDFQLYDYVKEFLKHYSNIGLYHFSICLEIKDSVIYTSKIIQLNYNSIDELLCKWNQFKKLTSFI